MTSDTHAVRHEHSFRKPHLCRCARRVSLDRSAQRRMRRQIPPPMFRALDRAGAFPF